MLELPTLGEDASATTMVRRFLAREGYGHVAAGVKRSKGGWVACDYFVRPCQMKTHEVKGAGDSAGDAMAACDAAILMAGSRVLGPVMVQSSETRRRSNTKKHRKA